MSTSIDRETHVDDLVRGLESELIGIRRELHAHPEKSGNEVATTRFIADRLDAAGIEHRICRDDIGVIADVTVGQPDQSVPTIAIRADIDALPIADEKDVEYASQNIGIAHACGHDAHTSMGLGAALAASKLQLNMSEGDLWPGMRLRFLFQPAEETTQGARWLVDQGAMENVDAILALHVDPELPVGKVGIRYGTLTAHCDEVDLLVEGNGGHAARPHHTLDPVAASAQLINALYQYLPRSIDARNPSVFTVGQVSGGFAPNVIPERVELRASLRTTDQQSRETLKQRIQEIAEGIREISHTNIQVHFTCPLNAVYNHPQITTRLEKAARAVIGDDGICLIERPSMGGEDFSVFLDYVPGALLRLGSSIPGEPQHFLHSPRFDIDERVLALGSRILLRTALLLSTDLHRD